LSPGYQCGSVMPVKPEEDRYGQRIRSTYRFRVARGSDLDDGLRARDYCQPSAPLCGVHQAPHHGTGKAVVGAAQNQDHLVRHRPAARAVPHVSFLNPPISGLIRLWYSHIDDLRSHF
jgi:hypothetical protein